MILSNSVLLALTDPIVYPPVMPYGVGVLLSALAQKNVNSSAIWPHLDGSAIRSLRDRLHIERPAIVGFSFRNLDMAGYHYSDTGDDHFLDELKSLVTEAKSTGAVAVIGGSGFSIAPREILEYVGGDVGFVGPSEIDFAEFCSRIIKNGSNPKAALSGLSSGIFSGETAPLLQNLPLLAPAGADCRTVEYAKLVGGMVPLRTKSGCPSKCAYCVVPNIEPLTLRPWQDIRDELRRYVDANLGDRIFIADGEFNLPSPKRAIELSQQIEREFSDRIKWRSYLDPASVTRELAEAMVSANCIGVSLSVDSFADEPRKGLGKTGSAERAIEAVNHCVDAGFKNILVNLIFGGPGETIDTAERTALIANTFLKKGVGVNVTVGLRVYPGTPLAHTSKMAEFSMHHEACKSIDWLGKFCSPIPAPQLATYIEEILRPGEGAIYNHNQSSGDTSFYQEVAIGSGFLFRGEFKIAENHFEELIGRHGLRPELELGLLKAKTHMSEAGKSNAID